MSQRYFAQITPGLEPLLMSELAELGARKRRLERGGVSFEGTKRVLYASLLAARLPSRLWLTLCEVSAPNPNALFSRLRSLKLTEHLAPGCPLAVRVTLHQSPGLAGSGQVESILWSALKASFEERSLAPPREAQWRGEEELSEVSTQRLLLYIERGRLTARLDASGELLHKRGWRLNDGPAPLRPTLAWACLRALDWQPQEPLIDPMCGSGTFSVEALGAALQLGPRRSRGYACERWLSFDEARWREQQRALTERAQGAALERASLWVSDLDAERSKLAERHLQALLEDHSARHSEGHSAQEGVNLHVRHADALSLPHEGLKAWLENKRNKGAQGERFERALIVVNPPYGRRLTRHQGRGESTQPPQRAHRRGDDEAVAQRFVNTLPTLQSQLSAQVEKLRLGVLLPSTQRLTPPQGWLKEEALCFSHGGIKVSLWRFTSQA